MAVFANESLSFYKEICYFRTLVPAMLTLLIIPVMYTRPCRKAMNPSCVRINRYDRMRLLIKGIDPRAISGV